MTEIQNPKQKNNRFEPVWNWRFICNLVLEIWNLPFDYAQGGEHVEPFVIWCLEFVILDTKLQGRAIYL